MRLAAASALPLVLLAAPALGDSVTPVRLSVKVAAVARLDRPLPVSVAVSADPSVLDTRTGALRARVKLAAECGGDFSGTPGAVLLDNELSPQPTTQRPYSGVARGSGVPAAYGMQTVCVFIEEEGDGRQFATAMDLQVDVSQSCTAAADRLDGARSALASATFRLHHAAHLRRRTRLRRLVAHRRRVVRVDRQAALAACGAGVAL